MMLNLQASSQQAVRVGKAEVYFSLSSGEKATTLTEKGKCYLAPRSQSHYLIGD